MQTRKRFIIRFIQRSLQQTLSLHLFRFFLLWMHDLVLGLIVGYVPSIIATVLIISFADLEKYKQSTFGKYVKTYMNRTTQAVRLAGDTLSKIAAWYNLVLLIIISMLMILLAWVRGKLFSTKTR